MFNLNLKIEALVAGSQPAVNAEDSSSWLCQCQGASTQHTSLKRETKQP